MNMRIRNTDPIAESMTDQTPKPQDTRPHCCKCCPDYCYTSDTYATPCEEYGRCADHALAAAVRRLPKGTTINNDYADGWWQVVTFPPNGKAKWCPTLVAAIDEAERE